MCFVASVWCRTPACISPSYQRHHTLTFMRAGTDDLCKVQPSPVLASQPGLPSLHSPAIQETSRPKAAAGKPARGSHGAAMLMHLCSQLPAVSHTPSLPAAEVTATTGFGNFADLRTQEPPQAVGGVTGGAGPAHAPNLCPQVVAQGVPAAVPRRRSAGASMVACIMGRSQAGTSASEGKPTSVDADTQANPEICPAAKHGLQHHVATASGQTAAGTLRN